MLPVASACGLPYRSLTSQVDLINTEKMGKVEFFTDFVNSLLAIISHGDLSNMLQKQLWQVLSRFDIETIAARFTISFALAIYNGRMDR